MRQRYFFHRVAMATVILINEAQWARPIFGMHQISQPRRAPEKSRSLCRKPPHVEHAYLWFEARRLVLLYIMSCQRQTGCSAVAAEASAELQSNQATRTGNRRLRTGNGKHLLSLSQTRRGLMASVNSTGQCDRSQQHKIWMFKYTISPLAFKYACDWTNLSLHNDKQCLLRWESLTRMGRCHH